MLLTPYGSPSLKPQYTVQAGNDNALARIVAILRNVQRLDDQARVRVNNHSKLLP
jgi:hypothetical protein